MSGFLATEIAGQRIDNEADADEDEREYKFKKIDQEDEEDLQFGSMMAENEQDVRLDEAEFEESRMKEKVIQRSDGMVGANMESYTFNIDNSADELIPFNGGVEIELIYQQAIEFSLSSAEAIVNEIEGDSEKFIEVNAIELNKPTQVKVSYSSNDD